MRLTMWWGTMLVAATALLVGCTTPRTHNLPPAERLMHPGPGVGGPGPGVLPPMMPPLGAMPMGMPMPAAEVQVQFSRPQSMNIHLDLGGSFDPTPLIAPAAYNFPAGAIYRLKLTNIPGREGIELYPSLELGPATPRTEAYLAHNAIPLQFTDEDFDQVLTGNFVTKVIYLPDPEFQELALAGVETLVSTRLDPGVDPIVEADRRGAIMAILRLGNKDIEMQSGATPPALYGHAGGMPATYDPYCPYGGLAGGGAEAYIAGVTAPQYGMTMSGTPIGLAGPPHIPFGAQAGLQRHVMVNHTHMHLPEPSPTMKIHVKQQPGFSYPRPANEVFIREQMIHPAHNYRQPYGDKHMLIPGGGPMGLGTGANAVHLHGGH